MLSECFHFMKRKSLHLELDLTLLLSRYKKAEGRRFVTCPVGLRIKDDFRASTRESFLLSESALGERALDVINADYTPQSRANFSLMIIDDGSGLTFHSTRLDLPSLIAD